MSSNSKKLSFSYPDAELVFGVCCAVGCNYQRIEKYLANQLRVAGYCSRTIKLSDCIREWADDLKIEIKSPSNDEYVRILSLMQAGNEARRKTSRDFLAITALSKINSERPRNVRLCEGKSETSPELWPKTAHILLTLKRPEEVDLLRRVYGPGFFLIGVFASERERSKYLQEEHGLNSKQAAALMKKDEDDDVEWGQKTRSTFHKADVFVTMAEYQRQLDRFLDLIFGHPYHTPTRDEHAMFLAYGAAFRSAQLGRQVGATVLNTKGDVVAVGCNEVPRAGGGNYEAGDRPDKRDHVLGYDSNDRAKAAIAEDILSGLRNWIDERNWSEVERVLKASQLFDITEFGRAVHAEMDALLSCARSGTSTAGATLFSTTFPCHNCTRHIIAAGVKRVVYIEPYPKSRAKDLHTDAIALDGKPPGRVPFEPFVGIGPRRYTDLFSIDLGTGFPIKRKADGKVIKWNIQGAGPRVPLQPISYLQREQIASDAIQGTIDNWTENEKKQPRQPKQRK